MVTLPPEPAYETHVDGLWKPLRSGRTYRRMKITAGPDRINGRGLVIASDDPEKPLRDVTVSDTIVIGWGDDAACVWGWASRIRLSRIRIIDKQSWPDPTRYGFSSKGFTCGADNDLPAPNYRRWFTLEDFVIRAFQRAPDLRGGVFVLRRGICMPSARNVWTEARGNIIGVDFRTCLKPADIGLATSESKHWDSWTRLVRPICLDRCEPNSLYFAACTLNGEPASGPQLCRMFRPGLAMADRDEDVPAIVFRSKPWR